MQSTFAFLVKNSAISKIINKLKRNQFDFSVEKVDDELSLIVAICDYDDRLDSIPKGVISHVELVV